MDLYEILKEVDIKFNLLRNSKNFVNVGCREGSALKYAGEKIKTGKIIGVELNKFYKINLEELQKKIPNLEIKFENPLIKDVWQKINQIDIIFNSLDLEVIKLFQAVENSLNSLKVGGRIINIYKKSFLPENEQITFIENFVSRLPLKNTQFFHTNGNLLSISTKKGILE